MSVDPYDILVPNSTDPIGAALQTVPEFLKDRSDGEPASAIEFWDFLRDSKTFRFVDIQGKQIPDLDPEGFGALFATLVLDHAVATGLCKKVKGEDLWHS